MSGPERGPSGPEDTPFEDRIAEALRNVSSRMDVPPRAFEPPAPCRHRGHSADPVRAPLRWVAAAALVIGITGLVALTPPSINDDFVVTGSEDDESPVAYDAPADGSLDGLFLDYVAPINGDDRRRAEGIFIVGYSWARSTTMKDCVHRRGLSEAESPWVVAMADWYAANGSPAEAGLPALQAIAEGGLDRPLQDPASFEMRQAVERCDATDKSKASRWKRQVEPLQEEFAETVGRVVAVVESGSVWQRARHCLDDVGAPTTGAPGMEGYVAGLAVDGPTGRFGALDRPGSKRGADDGGGSAASKAFAACAMPFYAEVERGLVQPREAFVEEHRDDLVRLQTDFADFA